MFYCTLEQAMNLQRSFDRILREMFREQVTVTTTVEERIYNNTSCAPATSPHARRTPPPDYRPIQAFLEAKQKKTFRV